MSQFNGLNMNMGDLSLLSKAETRSMTENFDGAKGRGGMATEGTGAGCPRDLGQGWKISPSIAIKAGETFTLADIKGEGAIQQNLDDAHWQLALQHHPHLLDDRECPGRMPGG